MMQRSGSAAPIHAIRSALRAYERIEFGEGQVKILAVQENLAHNQQ